MNTAKILLVEDDPFLREIYHEILKEAEFSIDIAVDGEDALNKIQQGGWDLVLMDVVLPKMNGIDVITKVKNSENPSPSKKIVFLTNIGDTDDLNKLIALSNGYLIKSEVSPAQLVEKVKELLQ